MNQSKALLICGNVGMFIASCGFVVALRQGNFVGALLAVVLIGLGLMTCLLSYEVRR